MPAVGTGGASFAPYGGGYPAPASTPSVPGTQTNTNNSGSAPDVIPGASIYAAEEAAALEAYQKALATLNGQRANTLQQYGYLGTINPKSGVIGKMSVDPNNPYGLYQSMLFNHGEAQQAARNAAEARGLGHTGLGAQGIAMDQRSFGADSAQLGSNLMNTLEGYQSQQDNAWQQYQDALWQAELAQAQAEIGAGNFNTAPPPSSNNNGGLVYRPGVNGPSLSNNKGSTTSNSNIFKTAASVKPKTKQSGTHPQRRGI